MRNAQLPGADDRWTDDEARVVLEAWRQSGDSGAEFARAHGLKTPRLYRWSSRLRERGSARPRAMTLVPAVVTTTDAELVIRVPNGVAIEITHGSPMIATRCSQ